MKKKKSILAIITLTIVIFILGCRGYSNTNANINTIETPKDFIKKIFSEKDNNKYVNLLKYSDVVYDENGKIKDEYMEECINFANSLKEKFQKLKKDDRISITEESSIFVQGFNEIKVLKLSDGYNSMDIYLLPNNNSYLLLLSASFGINEFSFMQFKVGDTTNTPTSFRVKATLDDYYNYSFTNKENLYYSINLQENIGKRQTVTAYIRKDTEDGKALYDLLKDGNEHNIIVEMFIPSFEKPSNDIFMIEKFISDSWVYPKDYIFE